MHFERQTAYKRKKPPLEDSFGGKMYLCDFSNPLYINGFRAKKKNAYSIRISVLLWQSTDIWIQFVHPGRYIRTRERNIRTTFARDVRKTYALHSHYIRTRAQKNRRGANKSTFAPHPHYIRATFTLDSHYIRAGFALHSHGTAV